MRTVGPMPRDFRNASSVTAVSAQIAPVATSSRSRVSFRMRALWRNTQVTAAAFDKTQAQVLVARKSNARAHLDGGSCPRPALEPQRVAAAQVHARELAADAERRAQPPGPAREIGRAHVRAVALHPFQALERFEGAQQHRRA